MKMFVDTLPPTSTYAGNHILQTPPASAQHPSLCARCTVMAKFIEWEVTAAGTHGQVEREAQVMQESAAEQLREWL